MRLLLTLSPRGSLLTSPFRLREHELLSGKFKQILKRREVASKIDAMAAIKSLDEIDDDFVGVCHAAKELGFTGGSAEKVR